MRIQALFLTLVFLATQTVTWTQTDRCHTDEIQAALMEDTAYARSYFAFEAALEEMQAGSALRSSQTHILPVVVHIMHDGSPIGEGSNLSEQQVFSAIDAMNADFKGDFGGADIDIEFVLAARDPEGNPTSGIKRTNVSAVYPTFTSTGMVTTSLLDPCSEVNVKSLSVWPKEDYINIWVLHKLNGGISPLGFAYLPPHSSMKDGIVVAREVFGVGDDYDLYSPYDLNRTLTHEMGHYLGLLHTFNNTSSCDAELNCAGAGDGVCDTPPTTGSAGCGPLSCPNTLVENFMDYSNDACMDSFTEGQRTRMRNALEIHRSSLMTSDGGLPVMAVDAGIVAALDMNAGGCTSSLQPSVLLQNFGTDALNAAVIHFSLDGGTSNELDWSGNLSSGETVEVLLPNLSAPLGDHTLTAWATTDGDGYALNDTLEVSFEVQSGNMLQMEVLLDALPYGFSWSVESVDDGTVIMSGEDYVNGSFAYESISESQCAVSGCYELIVEDIFGNGLHYYPGGWYSLTDADGNELGAGSGNFGSEQIHPFCIDGSSVPPCADTNSNGICDFDEDVVVPDVPGCTDANSCTYDAAANTDDGSCEYLDALGDCGGNCPDDVDGDGVCDNAEIPGCLDAEACNYDASATDDGGNCTYPPANYDCDGNITTVVSGCTDVNSCTYDAGANTDDGSCDYLDALGVCGGDCPGDGDGDGICDNAEIPGCLDSEACNYDPTATDDADNCSYPPVNFDCDGNITNVVNGCTDASSCTYDVGANTDDGSCEYLDALGDCGGDCPDDVDGDGICDNAEIPGCTDFTACNFNGEATDDNGNCIYPEPDLDCNGNPLVVVEGCMDPSSCTYNADANTNDDSCEYLDAIGVCGGDCPGDSDADGVCDNAEIPGCVDDSACNYDPAATDDAGNCTYPPVNFDCDGNITNVVNGCMDPASCTYDAGANTDDGSCEYLDAVGDCGGDCPGDADGDGVCDNAEIPGCTDLLACNYSVEATEEDGNCVYPEAGLDCEGNPLVIVEGCTDPGSCTYNPEANTEDGSCEYLDALAECGGDCPADVDGDGVCDNAEIPGCTDNSACNYEEGATDDDGGCIYPDPGFDCEGNPISVVEGCTDPNSCTFDADANTDDGSCEYLDALGECGGDCTADIDGDGICDDAEISGCTDAEACNYDEDATEDDGACEYAAEGYDCDGNPLTSSVGEWMNEPRAWVAYPNPARMGNQIQIKGMPDAGPWNIDIFDAAGKRVGTTSASAVPATQGWSVALPTPQYPGVFLLRATRTESPSDVMAACRILIH